MGVCPTYKNKIALTKYNLRFHFVTKVSLRPGNHRSAQCELRKYPIWQRSLSRDSRLYPRGASKAAFGCQGDAPCGPPSSTNRAATTNRA